jgi:hypothetical protein
MKGISLLYIETESQLKYVGLPDGIFSNQKIQVWVNFEGLAMEDVGIFYVNLVYLQPFGVFIDI